MSDRHRRNYDAPLEIEETIQPPVKKKRKQKEILVLTPRKKKK